MTATIPENLEIQFEEVKTPESPGRHRKTPVADSGSITDERENTPEDRGIPDVDVNTSPPQQTRRGPGRPRHAVGIPRPKARATPPPSFHAPDFSEWHDFVGNFALKWLCRGYIAFIFRGVDRYEILTQIENDQLEPDAEQLRDMAKPIAHLASKSKLGAKYGRVLFDSKDAVVAAIQFGMWMNRVNKIARKAAQRERVRYGVTIPGEVLDDGNSGAEAGESVQGPSFTPPSPSANGFAPGHGYN